MSHLIIPVYLNQRVVFDLVAMLQGGIATLTRVEETAKEGSAREGEARASFGLNRALSALLKVALTGDMKARTAGESGRSSAEERVHTPASLFFTLRKLLTEQNTVKLDAESLVPAPGDIIEFTATLSRNPLVESMSALDELVRLGIALDGFVKPTEKETRQAGKQAANFSKQATQFVELLKAGDTVDLTTPPMKSGYRAVLNLEGQYLNDPTMSDLVDGTFTVMGKVSRVVERDAGSINLLRKSAIGRLPPSVLSSGLAPLMDSAKAAGFALPDLVWEIPGPAVQVLPIAMFT